MRHSTLAIALLALTALPLRAQEEAPLSNLSATAESPLYTVYAAARERSEFALDEAYHLIYHEPDRGIEFTTDTGGDWGVAFRKGPELVHRVEDLHEAPVITTSYTDVVQYTYSPFEDVRVDATFLVQSSRLAVHDLTITNTGDRSVELDAIPYLRNDGRTFDDVAFRPDEGALTFTHEELPDGWVLRKDVPYVAEVQDVLLFSEAPDRMASFPAWEAGPVEIPFQVDLNREAEYLVRGRAPEAARCDDRGRTRLRAVVRGDRDRILTDRSPRWAHRRPNVRSGGRFELELGSFPAVAPADTFAVVYGCAGGGEARVFTGRVGDVAGEGGGADPSATARRLPAAPAGLEREVADDGVVVRWEKDGADATYSVYRRDYSAGGVYERIASGLEAPRFADPAVDGGPYGYVVTAVAADGRMSVPSEEVYSIAGTPFLAAARSGSLDGRHTRDFARVVAAQKTLRLAPGASERLRIVRGVAPTDGDRSALTAKAARLLDEDIAPYIRANERRYRRIPAPAFDDPDRAMMYWSAFTLMYQLMLPPAGQSSYNWYVYSREPTWGWGHAGQVFHESMTMIPYAVMDPEGAMDSQRVYAEHQRDDGYIFYRVGAFFEAENVVDGESTTSAPWYAWQNWEIYRVTRDTAFLAEMYESSRKLYEYVAENRDKDGDGLYEWGGHAILESVRDAQVAVWAEVGWPTNFESVGLSSMMVKEARALAAMAAELGRDGEARAWREKAARLSRRVRETFWDEETGFFYNVDRRDDDFSFESPDDLKRREIIGFLPLWAGIASREQAERLVETLTDPDAFWRPHGVPSLAADDPFYDPQGYWNGPVWVEWNYLIVRGLLDYGYHDQARELVDRVAETMIRQLRDTHYFWEFYSPDENWGGHHKTYIWAGMINQMMMEVADAPASAEE